MADDDFRFKKCSHCQQSACLVQNGHYLCLLHHCTSKSVLYNSLEVYNNVELQSQSKLVENFWRDAAADVMLRMYDMQKEEEELLRKDPLEILSMNVLPVITCPAKRKTVKRPQSIESGKCNHEIKTLSKRLDIESSIAENSINNKGNPKCENCASTDTRTRYSAPSGQLDVSRNETWGSKSAHSVAIHIECKACGHATTTFE